MKRYLLPALLFILMSTSGCAGEKKSSTVDELFNEFSQVENANYTHVNPWLMKMANVAISLSDSETGDITRKVKSVKVLSLEKSPEADKQRLTKRISALNTDGYDELIRVNDKGQHVRILAKLDKDSAIRHLLVLCNDSNDCTLVSVKGKFTKDDIGGIINSTTGDHNGGK